jgi:hypothetical protein
MEDSRGVSGYAHPVPDSPTFEPGRDILRPCPEGPSGTANRLTPASLRCTASGHATATTRAPEEADR